MEGSPGSSAAGSGISTNRDPQIDLPIPRHHGTAPATRHKKRIERDAGNATVGAEVADAWKQPAPGSDQDWRIALSSKLSIRP